MPVYQKPPRAACATVLICSLRCYEQKARVSIWLYENTSTKLEGRIIVSVQSTGLRNFLRPPCAPAQGFDEFMNVVLDDAEEVDGKGKSRTELGKHAPPPPCVQARSVTPLTPIATQAAFC